MGYGYVRSCIAGAVAPVVLEGIVKPAKAVASLFGFGNGWDLGKDVTERRKIRVASRQLRESLSTFVDPVNELINPEGIEAADEDREEEGEAEAEPEVMDEGGHSASGMGDSGSPPDLRRRA